MLFAGVALGMQIQQRQARRDAPPPKKAGGGTVAPAPFTDGLPPLNYNPEVDKVIGSVNGKSPHMTGWKNGHKQYDTAVEKLVLFGDGRTAVGEGIQGGALLGKDGKPSFTFSAQRATMNLDTKNLDVEGEVFVQSADKKNQTSFTTRDMHWNAAAERLECPNPVQVTQEGVVFRARRMTVDTRLKKLLMEGDIYLVADADKVKQAVDSRKGGH